MNTFITSITKVCRVGVAVKCAGCYLACVTTTRPVARVAISAGTFSPHSCFSIQLPCLFNMSRVTKSGGSEVGEDGVVTASK